MATQHAPRPELDLVAGARPNFMKIAPIIRALERRASGLGWRLIHTGQHYDREMSGVFFEELGIPAPDLALDVGSGSHAEQTAKVMVAFERACLERRPAAVVVVGDVNSTLAAALVAKKLGIPVAHVEAGLRSRDWSMPEEVNRVATDAIADHLFVTERSGVDNLRAEGKPPGSIHFVGHVMIDNLFFQLGQLERADRTGWVSTHFKREYPRYGVATLHRPANVDDPATLSRLLGALGEIAKDLPLLFPVHPRTRRNLEALGIALHPAIQLAPPLAYMDFLNLWKDAALVLTDSGGLQEETTALGVPCLTLRDNTERPITLTQGTNVLVGTDHAAIMREARRALAGGTRPGACPELWDGRAAERIVDILAERLS
ncbi:UDP-N-acetylglucosamine 2-epimerase (non-hydrolysing) [Methylomagnum ishizawai]|uniref:UDP-N-acetylglucosamine 2-epimerase (Non-hydrolysing) n=1 Tax=Methylomagnum ishizawai TaxID=1760988 RepID=A0A1Y6D5D9_9GAMM|nr:UDP-N-acetylglucosamine 2-epimerase (non-hydrolyzing) [Methylomagnum ishizawai]SMF97650.1 UDP-N-acetylglucosamine 2-epimerase (non-hydrolysing) [Methylomagnum ishizawai]